MHGMSHLQSLVVKECFQIAAHKCRASVALCIYEPQCITSLSPCLWVRFRLYMAAKCQYFDIVMYVCKIIAFVTVWWLKINLVLYIILIVCVFSLYLIGWCQFIFTNSSSGPCLTFLMRKLIHDCIKC